MNNYLPLRSFFRKMARAPEGIDGLTTVILEIGQLFEDKSVFFFLSHPLIDLSRKKIAIENMLGDLSSAYHLEIIELVLLHKYWAFWDGFVREWFRLYEDHTHTGTIRVYGRGDLNQFSRDTILEVFSKRHPNRNFKIEPCVNVDQQIGIKAIFRDTVLELNPFRMIDKLILALEKGQEYS